MRRVNFPASTGPISGRQVITIIEQSKTKRLATARLRRVEDRAVFIDLLFASSGIERELAAAAVRIDDVPVGRVGHLLALKVLSESERRLQDRIDIQELAKVATEEDWRTAPKRWCGSSKSAASTEVARS